ncbi:hypothetical protein NTG1052_560004 [Candidatus Nitrotoga sp. 1052]|nr:hypothetical protein NTG1052_560004 [Candidatus Nitrotoga sp. 1052]
MAGASLFPLPVKEDPDVPCDLLYGLIPGTLVYHSNPDFQTGVLSRPWRHRG